MEDINVTTQEMTKLKQATTRVHNRASSLNIVSKDDLEMATDVLSNIKNGLKTLKDRKEAITKPINEALKSVRSLFAPLEDQLTVAERIIKAKMVDYQNEVTRKAEEEAAKVMEQADKGEINYSEATNQISALESVPNKVEGKKGAIQYRTNRVVYVTNPAELPREYLTPDMVAIRRDALAGQTIPGVEVREEKTVAGY